jgi:hypothetical protein
MINDKRIARLFAAAILSLSMAAAQQAPSVQFLQTRLHQSQAGQAG